VRGGDARFYPFGAHEKGGLDRWHSRRKEHRIRRREIIAFAMQNNEFDEQNQISNSEQSIAAAFVRGEQPQEADYPKRKGCRIHQDNLLRDELCRVQRDVLVAVRDVVQELVGGPVISSLPKNVR